LHLVCAADGARLFTGSLDGTVLAWGVGHLKGAQRPKPSATEVEAAWADLDSTDAAKAYAAIWALTAAPQEALARLRGFLGQVARPDAAHIKRLIASLDDDSFGVREKATAELGGLGDLAVPALREALAANPSAELRRRAERALAWPPRQVRALEVLEHMDWLEARTALEPLAKGDPEARLTRDAKAALERRAKRGRQAMSEFRATRSGLAEEHRSG
jgi:hypothetical protein